MIGYFGGLMFEVNSDWIQTPKNFRREASNSWKTHNPIGQRPRSEFLYANEGRITFSMHFDQRFLGDVREMLDLLITYVNSGYIGTLVIGNKPMGADKWKITSVTESVETILHHGIILEADVEVTLEEYFSNEFRDDGYEY